MVNAIVTLLFTSSYLPGALVLGRSIRQSGLDSNTKLVVLLAASLTQYEYNQLAQVYDEILDTELIFSKVASYELQLLNRPELSPTYSKINIFKLTQFDQILYLDSDTLPLQDLTHLFKDYAQLSEDQIVAAPDSGWPDIFNSGLFLIKPSIQTYQNLLFKIHNSSKSPSFDGADQGLLNEYFIVDSPNRRSWIKLPFIYNVTPSGQYQYQPAYQFFQNQIKLVHFIGATKPWDSGRDGERYRWWDKYGEFYGYGSIKEVIHGIKPKFYFPPQEYHEEHHEDNGEPVIIDYQEGNVEQYDEPEESREDEVNHEQDYWNQYNEANQILNDPQSFEIFETVQPDYDQWNPARDEPPQDGKPQAADFPDLGHYSNEWDKPQEHYHQEYQEHHQEHHHEQQNQDYHEEQHVESDYQDDLSREVHESYDASAPIYDEHPEPEPAEEWKPPPIFPWELHNDQAEPERVFTISDEFSFDDPWTHLPLFRRIKQHQEKAASDAQRRAESLAREEEDEKELQRRKVEVALISEEREVGVITKDDAEEEEEEDNETIVPSSTDVQTIEEDYPIEEPDFSSEQYESIPKPAGLEEIERDEELDEEEDVELQEDLKDIKIAK
ncbi:Glycogenin-1 [Wickerhamomyces ciferrii]|uniref:glycogenin glucosyltransferase n=1 Tax=Wickerhamomyces ciferrii (strain ATCC 14091 / BCRC 22168 / CBS 111 / JCM 3599 / NBRC 0793 / NRRL Y-1031 F-60-10) TaxID=1206466 RepID=K0KTZ5_WICCF|nr:Glycogenin-1 [Wickerhamomyces ciferrii]CCH44698.1 Glycogenin-1 [Wickerhamomyces ciferrii]